MNARGCDHNSPCNFKACNFPEAACSVVSDRLPKKLRSLATCNDDRDVTGMIWRGLCKVYTRPTLCGAF